MKANIDEIVAKVPAEADRAIFHEVDTTLYSASSKTFIGQVYALFGVENIADAADKDKTGYPQLTNEYIVQAEPGGDLPGRRQVREADASHRGGPGRLGRASTR